MERAQPSTDVLKRFRKALSRARHQKTLAGADGGERGTDFRSGSVLVGQRFIVSFSLKRRHSRLPQPFLQPGRRIGDQSHIEVGNPRLHLSGGQVIAHGREARQ
jgi:hypothetical protein